MDRLLIWVWLQSPTGLWHLAPLLKVGIDLLAGRMWKNYSFISQSTSELIALAPQPDHCPPTRACLRRLDDSFRSRHMDVEWWEPAPPHYVGSCRRQCSHSIPGELADPMRISPEGSASASTLHVVVMAIGVLAYVVAMGGRAQNRNWFAMSHWILIAYLAAICALLLPPMATT